MDECANTERTCATQFGVSDTFESALGLLTVMAIVVLTCIARARTAIATLTVPFPSGEIMWDLRGDLDAFVKNYGPCARSGIHPHVLRIMQTMNNFTGMRLQNTATVSWMRWESQPAGRDRKKSMERSLDR